MRCFGAILAADYTNACIQSCLYSDFIDDMVFLILSVLSVCVSKSLLLEKRMKSFLKNKQQEDIQLETPLCLVFVVGVF